jgi:hypothetical protein
MCVDATERASLSEILEHEWLRGEPDLKERLENLIRRQGYQDDMEEKLIKCLRIDTGDGQLKSDVELVKRCHSTESVASQKMEAEAALPSRQSPRQQVKRRRNC